MIFSDKFSVVVKHYRIKNKLTQQELANTIDVGLRTYQRIENGEANPTIEVLIKLSEVLNFSFAEIFNFAENKSQEYEILENATQLLIQANKFAKVGAWQYNFKEQQGYLSDTSRELLEVGEDFKPDFEATISFVKPGENQDRMRALVEESIMNGNPFSGEFVFVTATGKEIIGYVRGQAEFEEGVCKRIYGTAQDISELKVKEQELKKLLRELEDIQSFAGIGRWQLDIVNNKLCWSSSLFSIFEIEEDKFSASYEAFLNLVHPEDREAVNEAYTNSLKTRQPYEIQHRLLMPDGRIKWLQEKCKTEFSESGAPLVSTGYALDITKYKNT